MDFGDGYAVVPTVFKREDYKRTKHDTVFSNWKVLIGSNDWEDFENGKEGVGRYRVQNLPRKSCPGLYELGVAVIGQDQGRRKLDSDDVLAVYLGQAESVRSRLQRYGRSGAHLRNVNECDETIEKAVNTGLFEDVFSKQGSVLYRWAPMGSKRQAEATEAMLLSTFDYVWNKGSNGERRQLELLEKLGDRKFMNKRKSGISQLLFPFFRNQVGIRIKGKKHLLQEERKLSCDVVDEEKKSSSHFLTSILKLTRSNPQPVSDRSDEANVSVSPEIVTGQDSNVICGVILPNMESCSKRPVQGRKRCDDHKGMRINAFLFVLNRKDHEKTVKFEKTEQEEEVWTRLCEAITKSGLPCTRSSPKGNKRCWQHKEKTSSPENAQSEEATKLVACGVKLCNGLICEKSPVKGRKRCEEHKGMRITPVKYIIT